MKGPATQEAVSKSFNTFRRKLRDQGTSADGPRGLRALFDGRLSLQTLAVLPHFTRKPVIFKGQYMF